MMTQEHEFHKAEMVFSERKRFLDAAGAEGLRADQVERDLLQRLFEMGYELMEVAIDRGGDGDLGATVQGEDRTLRRLADPRQRRYVSVFGEHRFQQWLLKTTRRRKPLQAAIRYFENNRAYMKYDEYLAAGYPIGGGVAEGACRHVVRDRMEQTGMPWTPFGAQSMLHLRAIYLNGDWTDYLEHHIQTEQHTRYHKKAA